jgi:asparagine synthase (glutamine-hydrolysing)
MCGICGFTGSPERRVLERMTGAVRHRGPDEAGYFESDELSFGMRRLRIVDVETGKQPAYNEDRTICVVFNGEIYNHPELRSQLERQGHMFLSHHSDTEVIVHLYEQYGDSFLERLNGMFAIALWDAPRRKLLLARDRVGIKPLFCSFVDGRLLFASEIKSLLAHPNVHREPDFGALYHYLSLKNVPAPRTAFAGIEQLRPGERLIYEGGRARRERWWRLAFREAAVKDESECARHLLGLMEDSVRLQMRSDVPIGAYLSGGLDSSSVVALMAKLGAGRIKTFSLVYEDDLPNKNVDRLFARRIAQALGTDHHEHVVTHQEVADSVEAVLDAFDEPFSGVTSTYFLTYSISQHVRVALSGDGADELFGSYLPHRLAQPLHYFARIRDRSSEISTSDLRSLAPFENDVERVRAIHAAGDEADRRAKLLLWTDSEKRALLADALVAKLKGESTVEEIRRRYAASATDDPLNRALFVDFESLLPDQVLAFVDRLSMAHSVEVRPPFLDHRLVEYAATLPGNLKIRNGRTKHVLKEAARALIPEDLIDRPKEGFLLPIDTWLQGQMRPFIEGVLSPARLAVHGLFRPEPIQSMLKQNSAGVVNQGPRLWNLAMLQLWWERYVGRAA